jgi:hypothetical protein
MALSTLHVAEGAYSTFTFDRDADHIHRISGKKRRTLHWSSSTSSR